MSWQTQQLQSTVYLYWQYELTNDELWFYDRLGRREKASLQSRKAFNVACSSFNPKNTFCSSNITDAIYASSGAAIVVQDASP